ncbi:hypothetical protein GCM10022631_13580 [Deinococcus rubellus]
MRPERILCFTFASRRTISRIITSNTKFPVVSAKPSSLRLMRLDFPSQANVRSTTQRRFNTTKPPGTEMAGGR